MKALDDRWQRMQRVIDARAVDDSMKDVPGRPTGLMVRTYKSVGGGMVEEYAVDTGLLREMRAHEEQAAKELGQWTDKAEIQGGGVPGAVIILPSPRGGKIQP